MVSNHITERGRFGSDRTFDDSMKIPVGQKGPYVELVKMKSIALAFLVGSFPTCGTILNVFTSITYILFHTIKKNDGRNVIVFISFIKCESQ